MPSPKVRTIGMLVKAKFGDATHDELVSAFTEKLGLPPPGEMGDDEIRVRLCAAYGLNAPPAQPDKLPSQHKVTAERPSVLPPGHDHTPATPLIPGVPRVVGKLGRIPNLIVGRGKWEGRTRLVTFQAKPGSKQETQDLRVNDVLWVCPLNQMLEVPYPFWWVASNSKLWDTGSDDVSEFVKQKDKRLIKVTKPVAHETVFYTDHGDKPGTEDLPAGLCEYFQRAARTTLMFKGFSRPVLIMIHDQLEIPRRGSNAEAGMSYFRDMGDEDIRVRIAQTLGTEFEQMLQNELWEASAESA